MLPGAHISVLRPPEAPTVFSHCPQNRLRVAPHRPTSYRRSVSIPERTFRTTDEMWTVWTATSQREIRERAHAVSLARFSFSMSCVHTRVMPRQARVMTRQADPGAVRGQSSGFGSAAKPSSPTRRRMTALASNRGFHRERIGANARNCPMYTARESEGPALPALPKGQQSSCDYPIAGGQAQFPERSASHPGTPRSRR